MAKDNSRQAAMNNSERVASLKSLRKAGVIDRATFRMIAKQKGLSCARTPITNTGGKDGGHRVPEMPKFLDVDGKEDNTRWVSVGSQPAVRFTK
ncbi:hypothetical protein NVP2275O_293 [Vibrio phage 2.275.O._10N.286.54.E11]|nr:hypothetical protein NVP2275O_293 [Vibrio phage 2.275.O._10N.286.54.E11]